MILLSSEVAWEETKLPRRVRYRGREAVIVAYSPKTETRSARFHIIDHRDAHRSVPRSEITFVKPRRRAS